MDDAYIVSGGYPLKGEVKLSGAKNVALKVIIAALLFKKKVYLSNIPKIKDVDIILELINNLGGKAQFISKNSVLIDGQDLNKKRIDLFYASKTRVSFMFFAPLLYKFGKAEIPNPGGCRLGGRPIDRSIKLIRSFGANVIYDSDGFYRVYLSQKRLKGTRYQFEKPSHTGTELAILLGLIAEGETLIENASLEPEIDDLINFLNQSGAKIKRKDRLIFIEGIKELNQTDEYQIIGDRNEAVTFAIFGLATKGWVRLVGIETDLIKTFINKVKKIGGIIKEEKRGLEFSYRKPLSAIDIVTSPHPGFMTDWQAPWAVLMTQAQGVSTIHETIFENRFSYVDELKKLGAKIEFFQPKLKNPSLVYQFNLSKNQPPRNPQAIRIFGPTTLHNGVLNVNDLRAGASLLIGAAVAQGESVIAGASIIERGYEEIDKKLRLLGLKIKKITER